jgi:predicted transcriptional regulator
MGIEELFDDIRALPPGALAEVVDIVAYHRTHGAEAAREASEAHGMMDAIMADPAQRAALLASIRQGDEEHARGETRDFEEVFEEILADLPK